MGNDKSTDHISEPGENIVKNRFYRVFRWRPRKDSPDFGFDVNVEIPAEEVKPTERFLIQVKTSETIHDRAFPRKCLIMLNTQAAVTGPTFYRRMHVDLAICKAYAKR
jgi:hypothetical protein